MSKLQPLIEIMARLRSPKGCPWDLEQTHQSLAKYAIEESSELAEAIESGDTKHIVEELGDVLLQVVFHSQIGKEMGTFTIDDVIQSICDKMVRRHPHIFSDTKVKNSDEVVQNWEKIKAAEKKEKKKSLGGPPGLPALMRADNIGKLTEKEKFDWSKPEEVVAHLETEIQELKDALKSDGPKEQQMEVGDILFLTAQVARHLKADPEELLRKANRRIENRYLKIHELAKEKNLDWNILTLQQKEDLWTEAKKYLKPQES